MAQSGRTGSAAEPHSHSRRIFLQLVSQNANSSLLPVALLLVPKKQFGNGFPDFVINALFHGVDTRKQTCGREL